jgi:hypothetical protein
MTVSREVIEGLQLQGADEKISYRLLTTPWGGAPTSASVKCYDVTSGGRVDATATVLSGSASVVGDVITCPVLQSLTPGNWYRLEIKFDSGGNTWEAYATIQAEY